MTPRPSFAVLVVVLGLGLPAAAQSLPDAESPLRQTLHARSFGMGGAFRAAGLGADILYGNPAGLASFRRYLIELNGVMDFDQNGRFADLVLADSTGPVSGGFGYELLNFGEGHEERTAHLSTLGLAIPLGQQVFLGASGRHVLMTEGDDSSAVTVDAGLMAALGPARFAVGGHNLIDISNPLVSRYYSAGAAFSTVLFTLAADVRADWERSPTRSLALAYSVGGELMLEQTFPLRLGFERDTLTSRRSVSAGFGYYQEGSGIDLSYRHDLGDTQGRLLMLTIRVQAG